MANVGSVHHLVVLRSPIGWRAHATYPGRPKYVRNRPNFVFDAILDSWIFFSKIWHRTTRSLHISTYFSIRRQNSLDIPGVEQYTIRYSIPHDSLTTLCTSGNICNLSADVQITAAPPSLGQPRLQISPQTVQLHMIVRQREWRPKSLQLRLQSAPPCLSFWCGCSCTGL